MQVRSQLLILNVAVVDSPVTTLVVTNMNSLTQDSSDVAKALEEVTKLDNRW